MNRASTSRMQSAHRGQRYAHHPPLAFSDGCVVLGVTDSLVGFSLFPAFVFGLGRGSGGNTRTSEQSCNAPDDPAPGGREETCGSGCELGD
jgi:hypothetical protein